MVDLGRLGAREIEALLCGINSAKIPQSGRGKSAVRKGVYLPQASALSFLVLIQNYLLPFLYQIEEIKDYRDCQCCQESIKCNPVNR
jgi:hypothetical protein